MKANKAAEFNPILWGMSEAELNEYTSRGIAPVEALHYWEFKITPQEAEVLNKFGINASTAANSITTKWEK
jgi:hypothetical protein